MKNTLLAQLKNPAIDPSIGNLTTSVEGGTVIQLFMRNLINLAFAIGGIIFFFMLIRGGWEYIMAGGDKDAIEKARKRLTTGFTGAAILFSTYALLLIIELLFGINIRQFKIPTIL